MSLTIRTLSSKLIVLVVVCVAVAVMALTWKHGRNVIHLSRTAAEASLADVAHQNTRAIEQQLEFVERDTRFVASFPAVNASLNAAMSRASSAQGNGASVPFDGIDLAKMFHNILAERPHFAQIRLIGVSDNWRELVRVERDNGEIITKPEASLQSKGDEPYMAGIETTRPGDRYFSEITLNREHRQVEGPAMLRMVMPVFTARHGLSGAIVINVEAEKLFKETVVSTGTNVTIVTAAGHHMTMGPTIANPKLHLNRVGGEEYFWDTPVLDEMFFYGERAIYGTETQFDHFGKSVEMRVFTEVPAETIRLPYRRTILGDLYISLGILLIAVLVAWVYGHRLTRPMIHLRDAILRYEVNGNITDLSVVSNDEIGSMASAFKALALRVIEQNRKMQAIFDGAASAFIVTDRDGRIEEVNQSVQTIFGYSPDELIGRNLSCLMDPEQGAAHANRTMTFDSSSTRMGSELDLYGVRKDGSKVPLDISVAAISTPSGDRIIGVVNDIADRKLAEAQLCETIEALERSNAELDQFAYVASHDLRAPLRVIENASNWLAEDLEEHLTDDTRESLDLLRGRVKRMDRLLNDLLQHSRIGRVDLSDEMVAASGLFETVKDLVDLPDGMDLTLDLAGSVPLLPRAPLQTILLNLVDNALKHHDRETGHVKVGFALLGDMVEITVTDDGPGIPEAYHDKVFDLFQTLRPKDEFEASGMGLAIVQKHVVTAGGDIKIVSSGDRGTIFRISWPLPPSRTLAA